jgi:hypothetical protein
MKCRVFRERGLSGPPGLRAGSCCVVLNNFLESYSVFGQLFHTYSLHSGGLEHTVSEYDVRRFCRPPSRPILEPVRGKLGILERLGTVLG